MSIGEFAHATALLAIATAMDVWPAALAVTVFLAGLRRFTRLRPSRWWIAVAAWVTAGIIALAYGLNEVLESEPPFPFG